MRINYHNIRLKNGCIFIVLKTNCVRILGPRHLAGLGLRSGRIKLSSRNVNHVLLERGRSGASAMSMSIHKDRLRLVLHAA